MISKEKILNIYKKGEWLLQIAILFQLANLLTIVVNHVKSGTGVFNYRAVGIVSVAILLTYMVIEGVLFLIEAHKLSGNSQLKDFLKQNWLKVALVVLFAVLAVVFAIVGICRYRVDRVNYNQDYDTTNLFFTLSIIFGTLYAYIKKVRLKWLEISISCIFIVLIALFVVLANISLLDFLMSYKTNIYMLTASFLTLTFSLGLIHLKAPIYVSYLSMFVGSFALIACGVIGGIYGFSSMDLFNISRLCTIMASISALMFALAFVNRQAKTISKENYKQGLASCVVGTLAVAMSLAAVMYTNTMEISAPSDMHMLENAYLLSSIGILLALIALMVRKYNLLSYIFAAVSGVFSIVLIGVIISKLGLVQFMPFYMTSLTLSIGFAAIMLIYAIFSILSKIIVCIKTMKVKKLISEENGEEI